MVTFALPSDRDHTRSAFSFAEANLLGSVGDETRPELSKEETFEGNLLGNPSSWRNFSLLSCEDPPLETLFYVK
jgi:hypothetical protein